MNLGEYIISMVVRTDEIDELVLAEATPRDDEDTRKDNGEVGGHGRDWISIF